MSIALLETTSPQAISGLGLPSQDAYSKLLKEFRELLTPHFHTSANKHGVEHHIVTHGPPTQARARRLDQEKLATVKAEFLQMEEMGIIRRSKSLGLHRSMLYQSLVVSSDRVVTIDV